MLQTEFEFTLPCGYIDARGTLHRRGVMRRATAIDEVEPLGHPRVRANEAYLNILVLARVITRLGTLPAITPELIEQLFATDFAHLQELYARVNGGAPAGSGLIETQCPGCGTRFVLDTEEQDA